MEVGDKVIDLENISEQFEISDVNDDNINSSSSVEDEIIEKTKFEVEKLLGTEVPERILNLKSFGRDMMTQHLNLWKKLGKISKMKLKNTWVKCKRLYIIS